MSQAYEVGIHLVAKDGISGVLANISKSLFGLHGSVDHLTKGFSTLRAGIIGAASAAAGFKLGKGLEHVLEKGNDMIRLQRNMTQAGVETKQVQEATAKAWEMTAKYQNISAVESMKMINDARSVFGNQEMAIHDIEPFMRAASFLKSYEGGKHSDDEGLLKEIFSAIRRGIRFVG